VKGKPLSAEDMCILKEVAEQILVDDGFLSVKEAEAMLAKALRDSRKPGLDKVERMRLQTLVHASRIYLKLLSRHINRLVKCYAIKLALSNGGALG
jgi:hypothetical protein